MNLVIAREELLAATARVLAKIKAATERRRCPLHGKADIALRVGREIGRYKVQKHFQIEITEQTLHYRRKTEKINVERRNEASNGTDNEV